MQTPDFIIPAGGSLPPSAGNCNLYAGTVAGEPVLVLVQQFTVVTVDEEGTLGAADTFETALRGHGALPLTGLLLSGTALTPGWLVTTDLTTRALITGPGLTGEVYRGGLPSTTADWREQVIDSIQRGRGLVVISASTPAPDDWLNPATATRASWIRAQCELCPPATEQ